MKSKFLFWLLLSVFILFLIICSLMRAKHIEKDLTTRTGLALSQANLNFRGIQFDGQRAILTGTVGNHDLKDKIEHVTSTVQGIGRVDNRIQVIEQDTATLESVIRELKRDPDIRFDSNSAALSMEGRSFLDKLIVLLKQHENLLVDVHGYTDSSGNTSANLVLSRARADAVREYIIGHAIDPNRIRAEGHGSLKPLAANSTAEGKAKNRRVELVFREIK